MTEERTIYQTIAARAPNLSEAERKLLESKREALLIELRGINQALGIPTETRKERRASIAYKPQ